MTRRARAAASAALAAACFFPSAASERLPFRLAVDVRWGQGRGSDAFRADLSRALSEALADRCFATVDDVAEDAAVVPADLRLLVSLSHVKEHMRYLDSIATSLQPGDPGQELRRVALFEVTVDADVSAVTTTRSIKQKHFVASISRQPMVLGEDPQATARAQAIERIVSDLMKAYCKSGEKAERRIREAMTEPEGQAPPR